MKILMLSKSGDGLGLAHYFKIFGHKVILWIEDAKDFEYAGLGMFEKVSNWQVALKEADLVLSDMVGLGKFEAEIKKSGAPYACVSSNADELELDRSGQMEILRRLQIGLPKTWSFDSPRAAQAILELWSPPGYVIKPSGNLDTGKTLVVRDRRTFSWALSIYSGSQELIVQEIIEGVEVSTEGWFDGRSFVPEMFNHTFEEKKFAAGDLGPNTGCSGNIVIRADPNSQLVEQVKKFEEPLTRLKYKGPIDLNCIVNEEGIFALEVTPRIGYDAIEAFATMFEGDFTEALLGIAEGTLSAKPPNFRADLAAAVRLWLPPYPNGQAEAEERGRPIILPEGANRKENNGYYLLTDAYFDATVQDEDVYFWAATDGVVAKVTKAGNDLSQVLEEVYKMASLVKILDVGYRVDIGERVFEDVEKLESWGVL